MAHNSIAPKYRECLKMTVCSLKLMKSKAIDHIKAVAGSNQLLVRSLNIAIDKKMRAIGKVAIKMALPL